MKKTIKQHALDALAVQDACNLSGVVHSFSRAMTDLWEETRKCKGGGTRFVNRHPVSVLYSYKIAALAGVEPISACNEDTYRKAERACKDMADVDVF